MCVCKMGASNTGCRRNEITRFCIGDRLRQGLKSIEKDNLVLQAMVTRLTSPPTECRFLGVGRSGKQSLLKPRSGIHP